MKPTAFTYFVHAERPARLAVTKEGGRLSVKRQIAKGGEWEPIGPHEIHAWDTTYIVASHGFAPCHKTAEDLRPGFAEELLGFSNGKPPRGMA